MYGVSALVAAVSAAFGRSPPGDGRGSRRPLVATAGSPRRDRGVWGSRRAAAAAMDASGDAGSRRARAGQRRPGAEVECRPAPTSIFQRLPADDPSGDRRRALAWSSGPSPRRRSSSRRSRPARASCARIARAGARADPAGQRPDRARHADEVLQRRVSGAARTAGRPGVYRKMHLVPFGEYVPLASGYSSSPRRSSKRSRTSRRVNGQRCCRWTGIVISTAICYEIVYPDLVRRLRRRRQRAADDDHQRRVVRRDLGALPALRAGVDARHRGRPVSGARRPTPASAASWIRTAVCSRETPIFEPAVLVGRRAVSCRRQTLLRAHRRRARLRVGAGDGWRLLLASSPDGPIRGPDLGVAACRTSRN